MRKILAGAIAASSLGLSLTALAQDTGTGDMLDADDAASVSSDSSSSSSTTVPSELPDTGGGGLAK